MAFPLRTLQISDHQQSVAPALSRDLPHTPSSTRYPWSLIYINDPGR
jgi:hypothetical protein